ncbi:hypothetical protein QLS31_08190 [Flavobacterium sp. XS2P24]|uniref:DUF3226 domain-containing protein n=1 Tax=Flavobacterium sp. XS2P24 TaxID=3041249 RepID=UPI0024A970C1|nr:DUF3226 domain-containing protein [Flavobacterium sp. XS2P24]MDI6049807.1 hypothetical protein [Flavobacterium sp. XS2P24]
MLRVFAEGLDDVFIRKYLEKLGYVSNVDFTTDNSGGWTKTPLVAPKIREYLDGGDRVVLVFDADGDYNGGGFEIRKSELEAILKKSELAIDFFLFPNNKDDGDFETLLSQIANVDRLKIFDCFDKYESCVKALETDTTKFRVPLRKSRVYAYFESFDESNNSKKKESNDKTFFYDNPKYWDLDSVHLESLRLFLKEKLD